MYKNKHYQFLKSNVNLSENKDHNWNWIIDTKVVRTELKLDNTELSNEIDQENLRVYFLIETFH